MKSKKLFSLLLGVFVLHSYVFAQISMYIKYDNSCMTKLEYGEINNMNGDNLIHYYAFEESSPSKKVILETAPQKLQKGAVRPPVVLDCDQIAFDQTFINKINSGTLQIYLVTKGTKNYDLHYVENVASFEHLGNYISYKSFDSGFSYDANSFSPGKNLSHNTGMWDITYRGDNGFDCLNTYTFRKASTNTCGTHTDLTICPEIGLVKMVDGSKLDPDNVQGLQKKYELKYVNNLPLDNYVGAACQGVYPSDPTLFVATENPTPSTTTINTTIPTPTPTPYVTTTVPPPNNGVPVIAPPPTPTPANTVVTNPSLPLPSTSRSKVSDYSDFTNGIEFAAKGVEEPQMKVDPLLVPECGMVKREGFHIVRPDESLSLIAMKRKLSVENLARWNGIRNIEKIEACQVLRLTAPSPDLLDEFASKGGSVTLPDVGNAKPTNSKKVNKKPDEASGMHLVKEGETVYQLAKKHGYTVEKFMEFNGLETDIISPGMILKVSNCSCDLPDEFTARGEEVIIPDAYEEIDVTPFGETEAKLIHAKKKVHILQESETLYQVSKKYGISVERIMLINEIDDPTTLSVGEEIILQ